MSEFLSQLSNPGFLAAMFLAVALIAMVASALVPAFKGDHLETRLKRVTQERERLRAQNRAALSAQSLRQENKGRMADLAQRFDLATLLKDDSLEKKLSQAGMRGPKPVSTFYFFRAVLPIAFAVLAGTYIWFVNDLGLSPGLKYGAPVFAAALGYYAPGLYISNIGQKRQASLMKAFPDALDMMLICVESGMSIEMAFTKVGAEIGSASPELAEELTLTVAELSYLPERIQAYENLAARTGHEGVKAVCMALVQAEKYGTPMGDALRIMAKENREMRMSEAEKKAAALPAKLTVPMILFFLPVLFLVVLGPAYIKYDNMQNQGQTENTGYAR